MPVEQIPIGRFSRIVHLTQKALRLYDRKGLLVPEAKDPITGYRNYTIRQLEAGVRVRTLASLGFSLEEMKAVIDGGGDDGMVERRLAAVRQEMMRLKHIEEVLSVRPALEELYTMSLSEPVVKEIPEIRVISKRGKVGSEDGNYEDICRRVIEELMAAVYSPENQRNGIRIVGPVMMLCYDEEYRETDADLELAVPVAGRVSVGEGMEVKVLPAVEVVSVLYTGPYYNLTSAYGKIQEYAAVAALTLRGPDRQLYYNNPQEVAPEELRTEVQYPILRAA
ncbi:effector-binding domain-containing protein [Methanofollis sp. W23]|uniref:MerR family transcriptional regulator n=1 Tax=Methanofollis sp. W23 TaxID=2817849 RepID=UPI001AE8E460|nr:MerR family transcriptional regulator [Methanofollis sp. W23]MBP2146683.1 effector-binding domain-containing protein [Methanofollis sp. W23]